MVEPKISLTLILPGSTMVSQQVAENKPRERKLNRKSKAVRIRRSIPAKQVMKLSKEAYKAMLEEPTDPKYNRIVSKAKDKLVRYWDTMSKDNRIRKHCESIAHDLGAIDFTYNILED